MNEYQKRVLDARKKFLKLTLEQEKELLSIYEEAGKQVSEKLSKVKEGSLNQRYLNELDKSIKEYTSELRLKLGMSIKDGILASAQIAANTQAAYFDAMGLNQDLNSSFRKMFSQLPTNVLKTLINGNYYSDGKSLDQRIWNLTSKNAKDIDRVIKANSVQGSSAGELAKQLEQYINPAKRMNSNNRVPGINKNIAYQAQRLARTSMAHASNEAYIQGAEKNPFCIGLKWNLSSSHYERQVRRWGPDICDTYAGKVFKPKEYPVGHPNCLCYSTQEVEDTEKARDELIRWVKGEHNSKLDKWLDDYSEEFGIEKNQSKIFSELAASKEENSDIIDNIRNDIKSGKYPLKILEGKQGKHIREHNNYTEGRSYLTISINEAQEIVDKYAGSGIIRLNQNNEWDNKEIITVDKEIGVNVNNMTNEESKTDRCKIHYSKNGTHIVPTKKE